MPPGLVFLSAARGYDLVPVPASPCASDTTPLALAGVPTPIVVEQTTPAGALVSVPLPTATDDCSTPVVTGNAPAIFPPGTTTVTFTAVDAAGNTAHATTTVTVVDRTAPSITALAAAPAVLSPANHTMVAVRVSATAADAADPAPRCWIDSVASSEPTDGRGDGRTATDWQITGDLTVSLRAERAGGGSGRVYTLAVVCADHAGNRALGVGRVSVPHDKGR